MTRRATRWGGWTRGAPIAGLAFCLTSVSLNGQTPAELPRVTGSVELSLQNLDVVVTDREGRSVHGLAAEDFEVVHGKHPVTVTNFREERPPSRTAETAPPDGTAAAPAPTVVPATGPVPEAEAGAAPSRPRRHVVLFIDRLALPDPVERKAFFGSLKSLLRRSLQSGDEAMVVSWDRSIRTIHPFSSDLAALERALDVAAGTATRQPDEMTEVARLAENAAWFQLMDVPEAGFSARTDAAQAWQDVKGKAAAMRGLIGIMAGMEGRKVLVMASRRFSRVAGAEFGTEGIDTRAVMESVVAAANAGGVTLYTIFSAAFEPQLPSAASSRSFNPSFSGRPNTGRSQEVWHNEMANLSAMAEWTGGVAAGDIAQVSTFADRIAADLDSWYSIGYPTPEGAGRSAEVSVRVRRPGLTVRVRRSLVDKSPGEQMKDRVLANLFRWDPNARLPIAVIMKPTVKVKSRFVTPLEIRVPLDHLVLLRTAKGAKGAFSVFVASAGPGGDFSEVVRQRREVEVSASDLALAKGAHVAYEIAVETRSAESRISVGVWDEVGREAGFRVLSLRGR